MLKIGYRLYVGVVLTEMSRNVPASAEICVSLGEVGVLRRMEENPGANMRRFADAEGIGAT
jgi:hypothetical protein